MDKTEIEKKFKEIKQILGDTGESESLIILKDLLLDFFDRIGKIEKLQKCNCEKE